ncbi:signal recognition particle-docking protein FtsY [Corynebacterium lowii]|nr:signal recognition particle-docking protein FtsY [Corynebacterium lowii]MDP9851356.1 fused signal recognition particle receptor [Corynebacterium lowii]
MSTDFWIIGGIALLVIAILVAILVVIGRKHAASKTVSFEKKEEEEPKQLTQQQKSGNYQAKGGFNFAAGGAAPDASVAAFTGGAAAEKQKEPVLRDTPAAQPAKPAVPEQPKKPEQPKQPAAKAEPAKPAPEPKVEPAPKTQPEKQESAHPAPEPKAEPVEEAPKAPKTVPADTVKAEQGGVDKPEPATPAQPPQPVVEEAPEEQVEPEQVEEVPAEEPEQEEATEAAAAAAVTAEGAERALEETPVPEAPAAEEAPEAAPEPQEEIAPAAGRLGKLRGRLSRSQNMIGKSVLGILSAGDLDEDAWEEIEDTLVMADLGTTVTTKVVEDLRRMIAERGVSSEAEARAMLREVLVAACQPELDRSIKAMPYEGKPAVVLVVGVNGTGKTTTTGKLARVLVSMGHKVVLGAADTFRAAAADQLETWGRRVGAQTVRGAEGSDPASVAFDAVAKGVESQADVVLVDTAGRLHTSVGLMDQLGKVKRVVEKKAKVDEVLLVLDATVGQNGLMQARTFSEVVDITGVVLTKLDGTAKGGIVFKVQEELGVPVKLVGLGEGSDDLAPFEVEGFVDALLGEAS